MIGFTVPFCVFNSNATKNHRSKRDRPVSVISSSTSVTEDYSSALELDSSDLEFYDLSDEDGVQTLTSLHKVCRLGCT